MFQFFRTFTEIITKTTTVVHTSIVSRVLMQQKACCATQDLKRRLHNTDNVKFFQTFTCHKYQISKISTMSTSAQVSFQDEILADHVNDSNIYIFSKRGEKKEIPSRIHLGCQGFEREKQTEHELVILLRI